jgi:hypothetical protein
MQTLFLDDDARKGTRVTQASRRPPRAWSVALLLLIASSATARAETLKWKLQPGQVLHYVMEQKSVMTATTATGRQNKSTRTQTMNFTWTVSSVTADGVAEITQHIDRIRMRAEIPPYMPFDFDSKGPKVDPPAPFEVEEKLLSAMAGSEFSFKMKPNGEIDTIKFSEATLKSFRSAMPAGGQGASSDLSEQAIKDQLLQSSPPAFPNMPLEPGATWTGKPAKIKTPMGNFVLDKVFTFIGPDPKNPKLLLIGLESRVSLEPIEGSEISAKIRAHDGKITLTFDSEAGDIASTRGTDKTILAITGQGQTLEQTTEATTSMSLEP